MREIASAPHSESGSPAGRRPPIRRPQPGKASSDLWRKPIDLGPDLAARLLHGLAENHRRRLQLFARRGARVTMHELLAVTDDTDLRVLSYFQGALSRKLRRLLADREKKVHLIGWDYASTRWDPAHASIVDGVCYVTETTVESLRQCLGETSE